MLADFALRPELAAHEPAEARGLPRDGVRMPVSRRQAGEISHHAFGDLPALLLPGDLLVVHTSATIPPPRRRARRRPAGRPFQFSDPERAVADRAAGAP